MSREDIRILRAFYDAFDDRDFDDALREALLPPA